jgi:hypothetical protein
VLDQVLENGCAQFYRALFVDWTAHSFKIHY